MDTILIGLIDFLRSGSQFCPLPRAKFLDMPHRIVYSSGIDFAPCNGVIEKENDNFQEAEIDQLVHFFTSKKLPFVWWSNHPSLETKGFQFGGIMKGISLALKEQKINPPNGNGLNIKIVENNHELEIFCKLIAECFGFNPQVTDQYATMSNSAMKKKEQIHFLAYLNNIPVATASLTITQTSAGIWNCATLPDYRKKGIGTALTLSALAEAKKRNYSEVMAVLMPKGMAWGLFRELGFKEKCSLPFYVYGASANEIEK